MIRPISAIAAAVLLAMASPSEAQMARRGEGIRPEAIGFGERATRGTFEGSTIPGAVIAEDGRIVIPAIRAPIRRDGVSLTPRSTVDQPILRTDVGRVIFWDPRHRRTSQAFRHRFLDGYHRPQADPTPVGPIQRFRYWDGSRFIRGVRWKGQDGAWHGAQAGVANTVGGSFVRIRSGQYLNLADASRPAPPVENAVILRGGLPDPPVRARQSRARFFILGTAADDSQTSPPIRSRASRARFLILGGQGSEAP